MRKRCYLRVSDVIGQLGQMGLEVFDSIQHGHRMWTALIQIGKGCSQSLFKASRVFFLTRGGIVANHLMRDKTDARSNFKYLPGVESAPTSNL